MRSHEAQLCVGFPGSVLWTVPLLLNVCCSGQLGLYVDVPLGSQWCDGKYLTTGSLEKNVRACIIYFINIKMYITQFTNYNKRYSTLYYKNYIAKRPF